MLLPTNYFVLLPFFLVMLASCAASDNKASAKEENSGCTQPKEMELAAAKIVKGVVRDCEGYEDDDEAEALCVLKGFTKYLARTMEEQGFEATVRDKLATSLEAYSCSDNSLSSSNPLRSETWEDPVSQQTLQIQVMQEHASSKIHLIENFVSAEECQAIIDQANVTGMSNASVAGGQLYSSIRKALQTNVAVPWDLEHTGHPISRATRRVYNYANHVLKGLHLDEAGQSTLKFILYSGRGQNDTEPDLYNNHCDGACDGSQHRTGGRVATMIMYCGTATSGGHTNFKNAGIHINPKTGDGLFFSYIDPETMRMDNGFSMHSGCPVYVGEKKVVTQWLRLGVSSSRPYGAFRGVF
ncbi:prolyl 4-hydroxylase [Seminavis robusta]|uniref:Prolyl 4-hydroxylase n=1 Tax=Seminavis robusta TaxID=568900 RepID=A0A9N8EGQ6_9STRA|nr:prolyl 4-hydroxylase [Seminavis robusta]|eukprot:Sro976_g226960.1 prolyl 4-hydroxylase (355) ;mRNA; f:24060-25213